jgi:hypothetical protein
MILVVSYDLKGPPGSYEGLYGCLKSQKSWMHYLSSTWLVSSDGSPKDLFEALLPHLNLKAGDQVFITRVGEYWGWLPKAAWEWMNKHGAQ